MQLWYDFCISGPHLQQGRGMSHAQWYKCLRDWLLTDAAAIYRPLDHPGR